METKEENKIQETEIFPLDEFMEGENKKTEAPIEASREAFSEAPLETHKKKKTRKEFYVELVLIFILGILVGVAIKTEAVKRVTMGFDDYKMKIARQDFNINKIQKDLNTAQVEAQAEEQGATQDNGQNNPDNQAENSENSLAE